MKQINPLVFTRYLYSKEQVYHSLLIALLDKDSDESLYWTYEIYHSKFQEDLYKYIKMIYDMFYCESNGPMLGKCIDDLYGKWNQDRAQHHLFGSMIKNLLCRPYNVNKFMETYMGVKCEPYVPRIKEGKFLRINMKPEDIKIYETIEAEEGRARFVLEKAYRFPIRKNVSTIFACSNVEMKEEYRMHWLYYCWDCPLWRRRIEECGGKLNHEKRHVEFDDDDIDAFYDFYGFEPDEQKLMVQQFSIGLGTEKQMTLKDFADKYGGTMIKKKIKLMRK
jgi:hypothetical protein